MQPERRHSLAHFLALNRTVAIVLVTVLFFGLGEQLWSQFMPVYLKAQTAQAEQAQTVEGVGWHALLAIGLFACLRNLFEGFCYIGGGQLTGRFGDRGSLLLFGSLTVTGAHGTLLEPPRIGVSLSEEYQLDPEQSTSAMVVHHPDARYFTVTE